MEKYQRLSLDEREMIGQQLLQGKSLRFIAECLGRNVNAVSREVKHFSSRGWLTILLITFLLDTIAADE